MMESENLTPLQKAQLKSRELREAGLMEKRNPIRKFIDNPRIGRAVKMFCFECQCYNRSEANKCTTATCPLWLFRKGKCSPDETELAKWQTAYASHMQSVGELDTISLEQDDPDEPDDETIENEDDED